MIDVRAILCAAIFICCSAVADVPSVYASACYSDKEAEAEQAIRIHSELMVIGLNCQHMGVRAGHNLYGMYRQFTAEHADLFAGYEQVLLSHFKTRGADMPEKQLNILRTRFANTISQDVAMMRPDVFCARYAPRIVKASALSRADIQSWAATVYDEHPVTREPCE